LLWVLKNWFGYADAFSMKMVLTMFVPVYNWVQDQLLAQRVFDIVNPLAKLLVAGASIVSPVILHQFMSDHVQPVWQLSGGICRLLSWTSRGVRSILWTTVGIIWNAFNRSTTPQLVWLAETGRCMCRTECKVDNPGTGTGPSCMVHEAPDCPANTKQCCLVEQLGMYQAMKVVTQVRSRPRGDVAVRGIRGAAGAVVSSQGGASPVRGCQGKTERFIAFVLLVLSLLATGYSSWPTQVWEGCLYQPDYQYYAGGFWCWAWASLVYFTYTSLGLKKVAGDIVALLKNSWTGLFTHNVAVLQFFILVRAAGFDIVNWAWHAFSNLSGYGLELVELVCELVRGVIPGIPEMDAEAFVEELETATEKPCSDCGGYYCPHGSPSI